MSVAELTLPIIKDISTICITANIWSSCNNDLYIACLEHYIDETLFNFVRLSSIENVSYSS